MPRTSDAHVLNRVSDEDEILDLETVLSNCENQIACANAGCCDQRHVINQTFRTNTPTTRYPLLLGLDLVNETLSYASRNSESVEKYKCPHKILML